MAGTRKKKTTKAKKIAGTVSPLSNLTNTTCGDWKSGDVVWFKIPRGGWAKGKISYFCENKKSDTTWVTLWDELGERFASADVSSIQTDAPPTSELTRNQKRNLKKST